MHSLGKVRDRKIRGRKVRGKKSRQVSAVAGPTHTYLVEKLPHQVHLRKELAKVRVKVTV